MRGGPVHRTEVRCAYATTLPSYPVPFEKPPPQVISRSEGKGAAPYTRSSGKFSFS